MNEKELQQKISILKLKLIETEFEILKNAFFQNQKIDKINLVKDRYEFMLDNVIFDELKGGFNPEDN